MREDKHRRKHRAHKSCVGPAFINKEAVPEDSSEIFQMYGARRDWVQRVSGHETGIYRPDPFGINDYFVDYSINKKGRWHLREEIADRIEEVQDPDLNLRVSASVHNIDRSASSAFLYRDPHRNKAHCLEYHDVSRDGKTVVHKQSKNGTSRLKNFTDPARPSRKTKGKPRQRPYIEAWDQTNEHLNYDEKKKYQPLHIHYTTVQHSDRPSLHNMEAENGRRCATRSAERISRSRECKPKDKYANFNVFVDRAELSDEVDDVIIGETVSVPTVVNDLTALVVRKEKRLRERKEPLRRFVDELMKTSFCVPTTSSSGYGSEEEEEYVEIPSTSTTSIPLVALPSEMFTRFSVSSLPHLSAHPRLPCFPPAWEIHQKETQLVLGRYLSTCVVARQYGDELRLFVVDTCLSTHPSRPQLPLSGEEPPPIEEIVEGDFCEICYCEMDMTSEDRLSHPFSLSCSHLFCSGCWLSHISQAIHTQRLPAACLNPDCSCTVSVAAAKGLMTLSSVELYENATIEVLKREEKVVTCPECKRLHYAHQGSLHLSCPCGASLCAHCSSIDHSPLSCDVFEQYNSYMQRSGFMSVYSTNSDAPIIRNLAKCPSCSSLMERSAGCNHLSCACGAEFCYQCGKRWTSSHYQCTQGAFTKMTLVDVFTVNTNSRLLVPSLLTLAIEARSLLLERRHELRKRLKRLPLLERKLVERTFVKLSLVVELCYLNFRRSRSSKVMAERVRFGLEDFFNTGDKNLSAKGLRLVSFHNSLFS